MPTYPSFSIDELLNATANDPFWEKHLKQLITHKLSPFTLHLAILSKPYLQLILEGKKTIESRFSIHRCIPYEKVEKNDVLLLKQSGGPIVGIGYVAKTWFYQLNAESLQAIREKFSQALGIDDPTFWAQRESASFATLIRLKQVRALNPIIYTKRDQRAWVIIQARC